LTRLFFNPYTVHSDVGGTVQYFTFGHLATMIHNFDTLYTSAVYTKLSQKYKYLEQAYIV
jgi:hypothetical protein